VLVIIEIGCLAIASLGLKMTKKSSSTCTVHNHQERLRASVLVADVCCICRFDKIIKKEIPCTVVYEDEKVLCSVFLYIQLGWKKHFIR